MKTVKEVLGKYKSFYAAAKETGISANQLTRWVYTDSLVDSSGQVWIKTKGNLRVAILSPGCPEWPLDETLETNGPVS
tara:strand:+ start:418 stop:651 length:234 start_codon:yes stop_codon:yes gene_type:complete